jgi:hypothetical protein
VVNDDDDPHDQEHGNRQLEQAVEDHHRRLFVALNPPLLRSDHGPLG